MAQTMIRSVKSWLLAGALVALPALPGAGAAIIGRTPGPTPFISLLSVSVNKPATLASIQFVIYPKAGSATQPVLVTYSTDYLQKRGYMTSQGAPITVPIFGLYASYTNSVGLYYHFSDGSTTIEKTNVVTAAYTDPCNVLNDKTVFTQARTKVTSLSYSYILLKKFCSTDAPTIIDTDGEVRWVGTAGTASLPAILFDNGIYVSSNTGVTRIEFDGTTRLIGDYADIGVTSTGHHNFDFGKTGIVMDVNTTTETEATNIEIDGSGKVLNVWDLGQIISDAMTKGGDDPTQFVLPVGTDWFHNNTAIYQKSDNTLIVSSRENFVIAIDYDTHAIKWILGDTTKHWYQFPSLRKYALKLAPGTLPPIGQHSLSITSYGLLGLFDDGMNSTVQVPGGAGRSYSAPRIYRIDTVHQTATEVYNYNNGMSIQSPFCSSFYEDAPKNYLIDYSQAGPFFWARLVRIGQKRQYRLRLPVSRDPGLRHGLECRSDPPGNAEILKLRPIRIRRMRP
jgi:hypothetical protein